MSLFDLGSGTPAVLHGRETVLSGDMVAMAQKLQDSYNPRVTLMQWTGLSRTQLRRALRPSKGMRRHVRRRKQGK